MKLIWFNSRYSRCVKANIDNILLYLLPRDFPPIIKCTDFNKNTLKKEFSYLALFSQISNPFDETSVKRVNVHLIVDV